MRGCRSCDYDMCSRCCEHPPPPPPDVRALEAAAATAAAAAAAAANRLCAELSALEVTRVPSVEARHTAALLRRKADELDAAAARAEEAEQKASAFPPGAPAIELYSQMLGGSREQREAPELYERWSSVYVDGAKLEPQQPYGEGVRVVQFDRSWSVLTDESYEIYHDYDRGGNNPQRMRDAIVAMHVGNPVAIVAGGALGSSDGSASVCATLRDALELVGASAFLAHYPAHRTVLRFAYAGLFMRGGALGHGDETFEDRSACACAASVVRFAPPGSAALRRRDAFAALHRARMHNRGTDVDVAALQASVDAARGAGVPVAVLELAERDVEGEKTRRTRGAIEVNLQAVAAECGQSPADLVAYLGHLRTWVRRGMEVGARNISFAVERLQREQRQAEERLNGVLAAGDSVDLAALERAIEVAGAAGVAGGVVSAAQEIARSAQEKRDALALVEAQLLSLEGDGAAVAAAIDVPAVEALLQRAQEAGAAPAVIQAAQERLQRARGARANAELETQLLDVLASLDLLQGAAAGAAATGGGTLPLPAPLPGARAERFTAEALVFGLPVDAARGLSFYCNVTDAELSRAKAAGLAAVREEYEKLGDASDLECLRYVLECEAGSSTKVSLGGMMRDRDAAGRVLPIRQVDDAQGGRRGMRLADFVASPQARVAGLNEAEVAAVRLYSTSAYGSMNRPLRDQSRHQDGTAHPLTVTVSFLQDAVKKLRSVDAVSADRNDEVVLWRGMANRSVSEEFLRDGGTELAPMSTTSALQVAVQFSASEASVLLRLRTSSFMSRGADISFLSVFPAENECLFPPLTYLKVFEKHDVAVGGAAFTVVDVQPMLS